MGKQKAPKIKETPAERALADIGVERMQMSRQMRPIRQDLFKRVADFRQQAGQARATGSTDFAVAAKPIREAAARSGQAGQAAMQGLDLARAGAGAAASAEQRINRARAGGLQGLAGLAVGESGEALAGMGRLAEQGQVDAINRARSAAVNRATNANLLASGVGLAGAAYYDQMGGQKKINDTALIGTPDDPYGLGPAQYGP